MVKCCTMPNGKHDTVTYRCPKCGIVKWQTEGKVVGIYVMGMLVMAAMVCS